MQGIDFRSLVILSFLLLIQISNGYKILGVFPHGGKSHFNMFVPIMRELAKRGHEVTVISHFPEKQLLPNYTDISLVGAGPIELNIVTVSMVEKAGYFRNIKEHMIISENGKNNCEGLNFPQIQSLIKSNKKFDVIIQEYFNSDCFLALNHIFKSHSIGIIASQLIPRITDRFGIPINPSYIPVNVLTFSDRMTFLERVQNTVGYFMHTHILPMMYSNIGESAVRKYIGDDIPSLESIAKNTSLLLTNAHFSLTKPRPLPPNVIEIAGAHLGKPKPLPSDIEKFISESKHGVIYFSFGSILLGSSLSDDVRQAFMDVFSELPQRVLWKYENDTLPGKPDYIMTREWMPQFDILSHPKVVAFISHGGLLGTIEAFSNGIPIVAVPFFCDQYMNAKSLESLGTAASLNYFKLNKEEIRKALRFILQPSVLEKAKRQAKVFLDRPMSPMDTAIWWIEYVARNGGSDMRTQVVNMPVYQSFLLDVGIFLLLAISIVAYINYKLAIYFIRKLISKRVVKETSKKTKKE